jgi:hypothetical protein
MVTYTLNQTGFAQSQDEYKDKDKRSMAKKGIDKTWCPISPGTAKYPV